MAAWAFFGRKGITGLDMLIGANAQAWYPATDFETLSKEGYEHNPIIYACITALMDAMEEAPILVEVLNRNGEWEEKPDHALARLLGEPNPEMSEDEVQSITTLYQKLAGNAFWEKERSKAGRVVGLWPMRPDRVGITAAISIPGERVKKRILNYTWRGDAGTVTLPANDVIHFKEHHPRDDLWGLPPLAAGAREGDTDNRATDFVGSFFDNACVPKGLLKIKDRIDPAEEKRIRERLREMYSGRMAHDPMILGEGSEWIELSETFKDMDFPNLRKITETRLCAIFKVPPIIASTYAGLEQSTYANYAEARRAFTQNTVIPMYRRFDAVLNRSLAPEFGENVRLRSDTGQLAALAQNMDAVWARATAALSAGGLLVNDFRREVGLDPVQNGNVFLRPLMVQEIPALIETPKALILGGIERKALPAPSEDQLELRYKAFDLVARAWEGRFKRQAQELFKDEVEAILAILRREGKQEAAGAFLGFLNTVIAFLITNRGNWQTSFLPLFTGLVESQAEEVLGALGFAFDVTSPEALAFLETYTIRFADEIASTTEAGVRGLVAQAQAEGWSVPRLREEITAQYAEFERERAEVIARTETIRSSNAGTHEAWRLAGIERTQWYASRDERTCDYCLWMHEQYGPETNGISMTENFADMGEDVEGAANEEGERPNPVTITYGDVPYPPLHPQCRCTILAVTE